MAVYPVDVGAFDQASNSASQMSPKMYAPKLNIELYKSTFLSQIANTNYTGLIQNQGDSVAIRALPDITINDHAIGQKLSWETPEPESQTLLIDKGKTYSWVSDAVQVKQSDIAYTNAWIAHAAQLLKIQIDRDVLANVFSDVHASNQGLTAGVISAGYNMGVAGTPLGLKTTNIISTIVKAGSVLDEQDVTSEDRWMVIPVWMAALIKQSDLKDASLAGDATSISRNGRLGMIDRFTLYVSNNLAITTDGANSVANVIFGHKQGLTYAQQVVISNVIDLEDFFGQGFRGLTVYGYKIQKSESVGWMYAYDNS